jgi:error-prone DNA polymerase
MSPVELTMADLWATKISPDDHPIGHVRRLLDDAGILPVSALGPEHDTRRVRVGGLVTHRQRPGTAGGIIFINLEDETGMINVICSIGLWTRYRRVARGSPSLVIRGVVERAGGAISIVADRIAAVNLVAATPSRDFR